MIFLLILLEIIIWGEYFIPLPKIGLKNVVTRVFFHSNQVFGNLLSGKSHWSIPDFFLETPRFSSETPDFHCRPPWRDCSQGFVIFPRVFVQVFAGKKSQFSVQVARVDHIVLIRQTDDICFSLNIKDN